MNNLLLLLNTVTTLTLTTVARELRTIGTFPISALRPFCIVAFLHSVTRPFELAGLQCSEPYGNGPREQLACKRQSIVMMKMIISVGVSSRVLRALRVSSSNSRLSAATAYGKWLKPKQAVPKWPANRDCTPEWSPAPRKHLRLYCTIRARTISVASVGSPFATPPREG